MGLLERGGVLTDSRETEEMCKKLLGELGTEGEDRPRLVKFAPVKESQMISDSIPVNLYSKPCTLQGDELVYKLYHAEARLVRSVLEQAGFSPTESHDWNILWAGTVPQRYLFEGLLEHQKINHFPGSEELTRKDRLYANVSKLMDKFGRDSFNFLPETFILPEDFSDFSSRFHDNPDQLWIAKPNASSQGKGIFLVESLSDVLVSEPYIVSQYIANPLLVNSLKFDMRVYVLVTSYDPLRIYVYEEGLARFASDEYTPTGNKKNRFMHLTNYSVNKKNDRFIQNQDYRKDNVGHKWSLSALFTYLHGEGVDVEEVWGRIYDAVIKSILAIEDQVIEATKELSLGRTNCFDLFGFDVLLDSSLKPWVLEVNLSPSLATDSPLDLFIKGYLVADTLNLVGVRTFNRNRESANRLKARLRVKRTIYGKAVPSKVGKGLGKPQETWKVKDIVRDTAEEYLRRGHFIRIYPSKGCEYYDQFFPVPRPANQHVFQLFGLLGPQSDDSSHPTPRPRTSLTTSASTGTIPAPKIPISKRKAIISRKRVSTAVPKKVTVTGDDILLEYSSRLIAALMRLPETGLQKPWRRAIEQYLTNAVWRSPDQPTDLLWKRLEVKHEEMSSRKDKRAKAGTEDPESREIVMKSFTSGQLEEYLRTATTGVTREVVLPLVGRGGVLSEVEMAMANTRSSSQSHIHLSGDSNEDSDSSPRPDLPKLSVDPLPSLRLSWRPPQRQQSKPLSSKRV